MFKMKGKSYAGDITRRANTSVLGTENLAHSDPFFDPSGEGKKGIWGRSKKTKSGSTSPFRRRRRPGGEDAGIDEATPPPALSKKRFFFFLYFFFIFLFFYCFLNLLFFPLQTICF